QLLVDLLEREVAGAAPEPGAWRPAAAGLYDALVRPLYAAGLERGMGLTIVPMGPLHQLPWAALHDGTGGDGGFLIEDHVVTSAPSARVLLRRASGADGRVALAVERGVDGPALPEAVAEAGDVASAIGADLVVGPSATELAARRAFPAELVHLAIHGQVEPESPLFSSLSFAPGAAHAAGGQHDGRLTVREILDLDARSELLVLSSCRGSASFTPRGEDWSRPGVGLADAFLAAGSRRVLSSRLAVSDAGARRLMGDFYRELRRYPPAVALNRAQRRGAEGEQGLAWIGFGLSGALPEPTGSTVLSVGGQ
ncbi:MAG: CHAT domain-containing protein, partial [Acidobacteriota bacterium]